MVCSDVDVERGPLSILAIGAHADDVELGCGGTLARALERGHQVAILIVTDSAYVHPTAVGPAAGPWRGGEARTASVVAEEADAGARVLGVADVAVLDYPTNDVPMTHAVVERIEQRITAVRPDIIFTHHLADAHQAHRHVGWATLAAARWYRTIYAYEPPANKLAGAFHPQAYVALERRHLDRKLAALAAHASQYRKFGGDWWLETLQARAVLRGHEMGEEYAEAFEVVRQELAL